MTGGWDRDLAVDLGALEEWGAASVVTLVEEHELHELSVPDLGAKVRDRHMAWHHLPIRDAMAPNAEFERRWSEVSPRLRHQLRNGFNVVVHCKGGLGRAGTIGARLLTELGWEPNAAINAVRAVRRGALETTDQERHVRSQSAAVDQGPALGANAIRDRAVGALLGIAVGDAVGTTLEFRQRDSYPRLADMVGGGPFNLRSGQWTDDTAMALALADSLDACGGVDEHDLMTRFVSWWKDGVYSCTGRCFDIGTTTRVALDRFMRTGNPVAGDTRPNTAGNGSLMRLSPVAIRYWNDSAKRRDAAIRQSFTTHGAQEAVDACVAYADLVAAAISGQPPQQVLHPRSAGLSRNVDTILMGSWRGKPRAAVQASGYALHSLEAALWSVGRSGSFEEAVLTAANLGEDADTTAAIAGQLAGAIWGAGGIPTRWLEQLAWRDRIRAMSERLFPASGRCGGQGHCANGSRCDLARPDALLTEQQRGSGRRIPTAS